MTIDRFMQGYKAAWEERDESKFCALFTSHGEYHNTPFAVQRGQEQLAEYWCRVKLQEDIHLTYEILASTSQGGIAHWHVTYQVASEELFRIWAESTGHKPCRTKTRRSAAPDGPRRRADRRVREQPVQ